MGFVHDEERLFAFAQLHEPCDVGEITVHREHGVAYHQRAAVAAVVQQRSEVIEVVVAVDRRLAPRQPASVDDRRVVQLIGAHQHTLAAERRHHAEIRREAGREQCGARRRLPLC